MLLGWVLARLKSQLALCDSCGSQEQGVPWDLGRAVFTVLAGEKMDPGQRKHAWLPLVERGSWVFNRDLVGSRAGLDEPTKLSEACAFPWQGGHGGPGHSSAAELVAQTMKQTWHDLFQCPVVLRDWEHWEK